MKTRKKKKNLVETKNEGKIVSIYFEVVIVIKIINKY